MHRIRLLGISASPREHGNSRFLLEVALKTARATAPGLVETELYTLAGKTFDPCDACDLCHTELGYCKITWASPAISRTLSTGLAKAWSKDSIPSR
jgi:multimeric flavodoxin WrbA